MTTNHTPGPWKYHANLTASENHRGFHIRSSNGDLIALNVVPCDENAIEGEANAALIAAAPKLLAAAKRGLVLARNWIDPQLRGTDRYLLAHEELKAIQAALSAAEPQTKED